MLHLLIGLILGLLPLASDGQAILMSSDLDQEMGFFDLEPTRTMAARNWIGLYERQPDGWRLEAAEVEVTLHRRDDRLDFEIRSQPRDAHILFAGFSQLSPGPVESVGWNVALDSWSRPSGAGASFVVGGEEYVVQLDSEDDQRCDAVVVLTKGETSQTLFDLPGRTNAVIDEQFGCDEPHFHIHWAGDLDRDGRLDLLVTFSEKYSYHPRQLLLSSAAPPSALVGLAGTFDPF